MPLDAAPTLTFPPAVADRVRQEYKAASVVLEYGSGGSTMLAADLPDLTLFSVESDRDWAAAMRERLVSSGLNRNVHLMYADIGPTREWGHPVARNLRDVPKYWRYPRSVWARPDFRHPDVILIDGRFRVACFLTAMTKIQRPTRVLFDDYTDRRNYHWIERFARPVDTVGRMAIFDLAPRRMPVFHQPQAMRRAFWPG